MLDSLRKSRNSKFILLAFSAIILVFIFWGVGPTKGDKENSVVAVVNGQDIGVKEYTNLYRREIEYYKATFKDQFSDEMAKKLNLRQRTLDILVNRTLAVKQAEAEGVKVSETEVQDAIKSVPAFGKDGVFDKDLYFRVLSSNRIKPAEFEKNIEEDIITSKMRDRVVKDIKVTDDEIKKAYSRENRKLSLSYIALDGSRFTQGAGASDDDAREYLKKNGSAFLSPARVKAYYAFAGYDELARKVKATDSEIKEFYEKNLTRFETPEQVKARHILIRPDSKAGDQARAKKEAKEKAEDILMKIKAGAKFPDIAKKYSHDPGSAKTGGDLGWFRRGVMVKSFEDAVFRLKKGEVSGVVETEFGFHIIQLEDRKEKAAASIDAVRETVKKSVSGIKARAIAREEMAALEKTFKDAKGLDDLNKAAGSRKGIKALATDYFTEDDRKNELARNEALKDAVFAMKAGEVSRIIDTPEGLYLVKVLERVDPRVPEYQEISSRVKERIASEKADEAAGKKAGEYLKRIKAGESLEAVAKAEGYKVEETGYFSRVEGFIPKIGAFAGDKEKLFELTAASPNFPEALPYNNKFYILKLSNVKEADEAAFESKKDEIKNRLFTERQDEALSKWLKDLRAKAKIKVYEERL